MDLGLKNKNVLVTGGSKGIGLAVAELFARRRQCRDLRPQAELSQALQNFAGGRQGWGRCDSPMPTG